MSLTRNSFFSRFSGAGPRVPRDAKVELKVLGDGVHQIVARQGFMEEAVEV